MDKNLVVIGGGPGGYTCAIRAAQLGAKVCLVEKDQLGGTCLNRGCIPTKALYREAEIINMLSRADEFGIDIKGFSINIDRIQQRKQDIIKKLGDGIGSLLKSNRIEVLSGSACIKDKNTVMVLLNHGETREITTQNIVIASGSKPVLPQIEGVTLDGVYTSEDILNFDHIPQRLLIVGGGVIGIEFASIFNAMGSKVYVAEFLPNILAPVDMDITKRFTLMQKRKGIEVYTSAAVTSIVKTADGFTVSISTSKGELLLDADNVLVAAGRRPALEGLELENAGILSGKKGIETDENYETNIKGIFAIGDVNGKIMLAHAASHQGIYAAERAMGKNPVHSDIVPGCIFSFPEIAYAGMTEDEAKSKGIEYKVSKFMFGANGKALTLGEGEGFVKVISDGNKLLGVHIMGPHASDLIHEGVLAISGSIGIDDIIGTTHAHPTLSEAFSEAVAGLNGKAINIAPSLRR